MNGTLFLVSMPIGNPEDITLRALRVLREAALIAAEDAHITRSFLHLHRIPTEVLSYRPRHVPVPKGEELGSAGEREEPDRIPCSNAEIGSDASVLGRIRALLASGRDVAAVCDAGTPLLADPGARLVHQALGWGAKVVPVPGPSAALAALVVSDLPTGRFAFDGFPPRSRADRQAFFTALQGETRTIILYETRRYLRSTLQALSASLGPNRRMALARSLTTPAESLFRGSLAEALFHIQPEPPHGEYVLILSPR